MLIERLSSGIVFADLISMRGIRWGFSHCLFVFVLLLSCRVQAFRCPEFTTSNQLVVTFEGLGGETFGSPVHTLAEEVNFSEYQIARFAHNHTPATIAACIRRWMVQTPESKVSIMGQGLGGSTAYRVAKVMGDQGMNVEYLILFDGREGNEKSCKRYQGAHYEKPENVSYVFNYFQCGRLPGRRFAKSKGVYNYRLNSSHVLLPRTSVAKNFSRRLLNQDVIAFEPQSLNEFNRHRSFHPTLSEVGEITQREALHLIEPVHNTVRAPASAPAGFANERCTQFGVSFECSPGRAAQQGFVPGASR